MKDSGSTDTQSIITLPSGITIIQTHPQKNNTTIRIIALRTQFKKRRTRSPVVIKTRLKTEKTRKKIPGTLTVTV
jgi:hypothetical protein